MAAGRGIRGLSQREFAEQLTNAGFRIDAPAVSRIEKGTRAVRLAEALIIADVLDVDISMLVNSLDRSPSAELKRTRRHATEAYHQLREPLAEFLQSYLWVYEQLEERPELVREIDIDGDTISTPEEYFRLARDRIAILESEAVAEQRRDPNRDYAIYRSDVARAGIISVVTEYVDAVLISESTRQQLEQDRIAARHTKGDPDGSTSDTAE